MSSLRSTFLIAVVVASMSGCGAGSPTFDPSTAYTPESLAQELLFRYKSLDPGRRAVRSAKPARKPAAAVTKDSKAQTKEAQASTLDDLVRETADKAASVAGMSQAEALRKVAEAVGKDTSVSEADRKTIADRLQGVGE